MSGIIAPQYWKPSCSSSGTRKKTYKSNNMGHASGCVVSSFSLLIFLLKEWRKRKVHQGLTAQFGKTIVRILAIRIDMHILAQLK
jgi:hypothetical protein